MMTMQTSKARDELKGTIKGKVLVPDQPDYEEARQTKWTMVTPHSGP